MNRQDVIARLTEVLIDTFDDDALVYSDDLTAHEVDGWDSLSNIRLMVAVEQAFGCRISITQWQGRERLGQLVDLLCVQANRG